METHQSVLENMRINLQRKLPEVRQCKPHKHIMSIAGGGPSLADTKEQLKGYICAVNGSLRYLLSEGIEVNACGVVDPGEHLAEIIEARPDIHYFIASQAHPKVFEKLKGCHVVMWHASGPEGSEELLKQARPDDWFMIGGGSTMGVRWLNLGHACGFREFHVHGLDSSYRNGQTHAYQERERQNSLVVGGFETSPAFLQQVTDFAATKALLNDSTIHLYGEGLLQSQTPGYWESNADLEHITPPGERWPEGEEIKETLKRMVGDDSVLDFGCGDGRFVESFTPEQYTGVDINPHAIDYCKKRYPDYRFGFSIHHRDVALCFTSLLHVPDSEIENTINRLSCCDRVIVGEIMGRGWRRNGNPPVYNRDKGEYFSMFEAAGMRINSLTQIPYNRYGGTDLTILEFGK